jgi:RIO-like serine/threonine protein kinase
MDNANESQMKLKRSQHTPFETMSRNREDNYLKSLHSKSWVYDSIEGRLRKQEVNGWVKVI